MKERENSTSKEKTAEPFPSRKTPAPPQAMDPSKKPVKGNEEKSHKSGKKSR